MNRVLAVVAAVAVLELAYRLADGITVRRTYLEQADGTLTAVE